MLVRRLPRKILIIEEKKEKKQHLSKNDKVMLESNRDLLYGIDVSKLYSQDKKWIEERRI